MLQPARVFFCLALVLSLSWVASASPAGEPTIQEREGNAIMMDDSFEYSVADFGLGRVQVRPLGVRSDLTEPVFWVKFRITNRAEHLIKAPRYFPSINNAVQMTDNWGNAYALRYPSGTDVGFTWDKATLPLSAGEGKERYKPGESFWALRIIHPAEFVEDLKQLRIALANQSENCKVSFKIDEPLLRRKDMLFRDVELQASGLRIKVVTEKNNPASCDGHATANR